MAVLEKFFFLAHLYFFVVVVFCSNSMGFDDCMNVMVKDHAFGNITNDPSG